MKDFELFSVWLFLTSTYQYFQAKLTRTSWTLDQEKLLTAESVKKSDHFLGHESTCCSASKAHQKIRQITAGWSNAPPAQAWGASRDDVWSERLQVQRN